MDCSLIATAIDTTLVLNILHICISTTYGTQFLRSSQRVVGMRSRYHIDIHRRAGIHITT